MPRIDCLGDFDNGYVSYFSDMKNAVIGNNKQKANLIVLGAVPRCVSAQLYTSNTSDFAFVLTSHFLTIKNVVQAHSLCSAHWHWC